MKEPILARHYSQNQAVILQQQQYRHYAASTVGQSGGANNALRGGDDSSTAIRMNRSFLNNSRRNIGGGGSGGNSASGSQSGSIRIKGSSKGPFNSSMNSSQRPLNGQDPNAQSGGGGGDENWNSSNVKVSASEINMDSVVGAEAKLSPLLTFKSPSERRNLLLGCLLVRTHKAKLRYDKMMHMDMRAVVDPEGKGHLSNNVNEMLYHFHDAILVMNSREHILIQNSPKMFELIRESIFEWMREHEKAECKLNPIALGLSKWISECLQEWLALNEFMSIKVNFDPQLIEIGRESKYLDRMGFDISDSAQKVFLQETKFLVAIDRLQDLLNHYNAVIQPLEYHERCAVRRCFKSLYKTLRPGTFGDLSLVIL